MFGHYLVTLYRSLTRHRLYAVLNVLGLAVGIAVFLVLTLYVQFQTSFERWIPNAGEIYPVRMTWNFPGHAPQSFNYTMGGLLDELRADFPQLVGARTWDQSGTVRRGAEVTQQQVEVADPNLFRVLDIPLAEGDRASLLERPDDVVLTQSTARKYLGAGPAFGRTLDLSLQGELHRYRVAGVLFDPPKSTDLNFDMVVPLTAEMTDKTHAPFWSHWGSSQSVTNFLRLTPGAAEVLNGQLDGFTDRRGHLDMGSSKPPHLFLKLRVTPLLGVHLIEPADRMVVTTLGVVGVLTLVLAVVNYVNLATARAGLRAREVAVRKVMGATSGHLVAQFLSESVATVAIAALLGLALTEVGLPLVNAAGGLSLKLHYLGPASILPWLVLGTLLVGLATGAYPAFILSRFRPAPVLASSRTPGGGRAGSRVREALVTAQFVVAVAFTVATGVILSQTRYLHAADLGFRRSGLIVVKSFDDSDVTAAQRSTLLALWRTLPGMVSATSADIGPGVTDETNATGSKRPGAPGEPLNTNYVQSGPDFFTTVGARFLAGRPLDRDHGLDDATPIFNAHTPEERAAAAGRPSTSS